MGLTSIMKESLIKIRRVQNLNARVTLLWKRRVLGIAVTVHGSQENHLAAVVSSTAEALVDSSDKPNAFQSGNKIIRDSDRQLDAIQAPEAGREEAMENASREDFQAFKKIEALCQEDANAEVEKLCQTMVHGLREVQDRLSNQQVIPIAKSFNRLQTEMARVQEKIAYATEWLDWYAFGLQMTIICLICNFATDTNLQVVVSLLERPDPENAIRMFVSLDYTFADVAIELSEIDPLWRLPDFWFPKNKVYEAPPTNNHESRCDRIVDIVTGKDGYYIVVLVEKEGVDTGRAVDLPPARIERSVISYMKPIFQAHTVSKILDLNDRITDVSRKAFNRHEFLPFTNTIFIKLG